MSRYEKRMHQAAQLQAAQDGLAVESVRLFSFSNLVKGSQVTFAPEDAIVVLKSKTTNPNVHPCAQWLGLSQELYRRNPVLGNQQFVLDTTGLPAQLEFEEEASLVLGGPVVKRTVNILSKANLNRGTLVAAGASATLGAKLLLLGDRSTNSRGDPFFSSLLLVCPKSAEPLEALVRHAARHHRSANDGGSNHRQWKLTVLLSDSATAAEVSRWDELLRLPEVQIFFPLSTAAAVRQAKQVSLFASIASALGIEASGKVMSDDSELRLTRLVQPRLYEHVFVQSRFTKQAEQEIESRDMDEWGTAPSPPTATHSSSQPNGTDRVEPTSGASRGVCANGHHTPSGSGAGASVVEKAPPLCELSHCRRKDGHVFEMDVYVIDAAHGIVANAHGAVSLTNSVIVQENAGKVPRAPKLDLSLLGQGALEPNAAVRVRVVVRRSLKGRMSLELVDGADSLRVLSSDEIHASPSLSSCVTGAATWLNISQVCMCFGLLIIRGHQCVLVRSLSGEYAGMRFPYQPHDDATQSAIECATEAACIQCDISEDNFAVHPCIAPVMYYPAPNTCVTIFVAVANFPPNVDGVGQDEALEDPYDWKPYDSALQSLTTKSERSAFAKLVDNIQCAASAKMYIPPHNLAVFGPSSSVNPRPSDLLDEESLQQQQQATAAVVVVHTSDPTMGPVELLSYFGVDANGSSDDHDVLCIKGLLGSADSPSAIESVIAWLKRQSQSASNPKYVVLDATMGKDSVTYFLSYLPDLVEAVRCEVRLVEVVSPAVEIAIQNAIPAAKHEAAAEAPRAAAPSLIDIAALVAGLEAANLVLVPDDGEVGASTDRRMQALDFIRVVISDVNPVPVVADWHNPDAYLIDLDEHAQSDRPSDQPFTFTRYVYERGLPFHPTKFNELCSSPSTFAEKIVEPLSRESLELMSMSGFVWISTRFGYRGEVMLAASSHGAAPTVAIVQGDPWWCLIGEADRPSSCDPSSWDKKHGDRRQFISFIIAHTPCYTLEEHQKYRDTATSLIDGALDAGLCAAHEWRTWNRHTDPLAVWND